MVRQQYSIARHGHGVFSKHALTLALLVPLKDSNAFLNSSLTGTRGREGVAGSLPVSSATDGAGRSCWSVDRNKRILRILEPDLAESEPPVELTGASAARHTSDRWYEPFLAPRGRPDDCGRLWRQFDLNLVLYTCMDCCILVQYCDVLSGKSRHPSNLEVSFHSAEILADFIASSSHHSAHLA